ncbi:ROK family protein [Jatrophihabitans sp. DSM 45814]
MLEVGGTHVTAAWVQPDSWQITASHRREIDAAATAETLIAEFAAAAAELVAPAGVPWGIAMPGPFDYASGVAAYNGVGKFEGLHGVDVRSALTRATADVGSPGAISFINDASAFLLGEWLIGAARGSRRSAAITLGSGIGSAFLADGVIIDSGAEVPPDGEAHLLNHDGLPLEDWVSRRAIRRRYAEAASVTRHGAAVPIADEIDVREIADRARAGDALARDIFDSAFEVLGTVLGPWLDGFGAEVVVVGGSISKSWDLIEPPFRRGLARSTPIPLRLTADADRSALAGTAYSCASRASLPAH